MLISVSSPGPGQQQPAQQEPRHFRTFSHPISLRNERRVCLTLSRAGPNWWKAPQSFFFGLAPPQNQISWREKQKLAWCQLFFYSGHTPGTYPRMLSAGRRVHCKGEKKLGTVPKKKFHI
ncbi:ORF1 [Sparus aurata polyomavirus 1]|uniref:ORF1 n=1 Tax=Sparus aurata polyomavirus 1 TaxID=1885927 RepID=A0A1B2RW94_9POLY|nr:ORF1 [Sparus aurata polyomavirus 1]AOC55269.1 ORF1 [Sparus aurata polyomavirus 1]